MIRSAHENEWPSLRRYKDLVEGKALARYLLARAVPVEPFEDLDTCEMWKAHDRGVDEYLELVDADHAPRPASPSLMDLKAAMARRMLASCRLCAHDCKVDRRERRGYCGTGPARVASQFVHMGEEEMLVPSYTVFFAGCNLRCVFCQNHDISTRPDAGVEVPAPEMAASIGKARARGVRNINWVGGDPAPDLHYVLEVLAQAEASVAQVWNSNMYLSKEAMSLLDGTMDVHLTDLKFGNDDCALRLCGASEYMKVVTRNHMAAASQCEVIVRHLMLPGHLECCTVPVLDWLAENLPGAPVNVMAQYRPEHRACEFSELRKRLPRSDHIKAVEHARRMGLRLI